MANGNSCFYANKQQIINSLNTLKNKADKELQKLIDEEISSLRTSFDSKRMKVGGSSNLCRGLTIAVLLGGSTGASYLSFLLSKKFVIGRVIAPLCSSKTDQLTGYLLSFVNPSSSCLARQEAWDKFRQYVLGSVSIMSLVTGTVNYYKKIYEQLLPVCKFISEGCLSAVHGVGSLSKKGFSKLRTTLGKRKPVETEFIEEIEEEFITPSSSQSLSPRPMSLSSKSQSKSASPRITMEVQETLSDVYRESSNPKSKSASRERVPQPPRSMVFSRSESPRKHSSASKSHSKSRTKSLKGGKRKTRKYRHRK